MASNPEKLERLAWVFMVVSFLILCLILISTPLGIRQFIATASERLPARVTAYGGAVLISSAGNNAWTAISQPDQEVQEGIALKTEATSFAVVRLFDDSNLQVRNNSRMAILEARTPRFDSSPRPSNIRVEVQSGKVIVGVAPVSQTRPRQFEVYTPHGVVQLEEGSYSINVTESETEVSVRTERAGGHAVLQAAGGSISLGWGERARIEAGCPPEGPLPGERNFLVNGDFQQPLSVGWILWEKRERPEEVAGSATIETISERPLVHFVRRGDSQQHGENGIRQELDLDVRDAGSLEVRFNVRLLEQSLSGGGWLSSEFPLMVRLLYRDANGREHDWVRGFYYTNWEDRPVRDEESYRGVLVPQNLWYSFESKNLMLSLGDQRPAHLISLAIYASGHDYESMVSDVGLFVKE